MTTLWEAHPYRVITKAEIEDSERFCLTFTEGPRLIITDQGQSCCEYRHMSSDDDLSCLIGGTLLRIEEKEVREDVSDFSDCHDLCFVEVVTTKGTVTLVNHNEHNGYYAGFSLCVTEEK